MQVRKISQCLSGTVVRANRHTGASQVDCEGMSEASMRWENLVQGRESRKQVMVVTEGGTEEGERKRWLQVCGVFVHRATETYGRALSIRKTCLHLWFKSGGCQGCGRDRKWSERKLGREFRSTCEKSQTTGQGIKFS